MTDDCRKVFNVKLSLNHLDENMSDTVKEQLQWSGAEAGQTGIGWCAGTHIASAIERLFPGDSYSNAVNRRECFEAILDYFTADDFDDKYLNKESTPAAADAG